MTAVRDDGRAFCARVLPDVSRTFALVIRLLPQALSHAVAVSYLVCRIADSIEDQPGLLRDRRLHHFAALRRAVIDPTQRVDDLDLSQFDPDVRELMGGTPLVLGELHRLPTGQQQAIRPWVLEMIDGMASSLPPDDRHDQPLFATMAELRRYCFYVAGTVGHMLTGLFVDHQPPRTPAIAARLEELAPSFGLVLQLTNIIRDVSADKQLDRDHVPTDIRDAVGLARGEMFAAGRERESWQVLVPLLAEAQASVAPAVEYITLLPRRGVRVRLFCLTPLLHACRTLALLEAQRGVLAPRSTVRMSRREVYQLTAMAALAAPSNAAVRAVVQYARRAARPTPATASSDR
ncbi:MAG: squalene/phytoene synthase family protein [Gemmatimonadales bacterium]